MATHVPEWNFNHLLSFLSENRGQPSFPPLWWSTCAKDLLCLQAKSRRPPSRIVAVREWASTFRLIYSLDDINLMDQPLLNFHFLLLSNPSVQHLLLSSYIPTLLTKTGTFLYSLLTFYLNKGVERWCTELLSVRSSWLSSTKPHHPFPVFPFLDAAARSLLSPGTLKRGVGVFWDGEVDLQVGRRWRQGVVQRFRWERQPIDSESDMSVNIQYLKPHI